MFNILWITVAGLVSMVALRITFNDVFSLGTPSQAQGAIDAGASPVADAR
jgi:hypothetical protein